jgi:protein-S-isoprenylcysteine O-methyltransferase Ste14
MNSNREVLSADLSVLPTKGDRSSRKRPGEWLFHRRAWIGGIAVGLAGLVLTSQPALTLDPSTTLIGMVLGAAVLAGRVVIAGYTRSGCSSGCTSRLQGKELSTSGFYSTVRHPLYLLNILLVASSLITSGNWWLVSLGTFSTALFLREIARAEDHFLDLHFKIEFRRWAARTPAFLPNPALWQPWSRVFVPARALRREYSTVFAFMMASTLFAGLRSSSLESIPLEFPSAFLIQSLAFLGVRWWIKRHAKSFFAQGKGAAAEPILKRRR